MWKGDKNKDTTVQTLQMQKMALVHVDVASACDRVHGAALNEVRLKYLTFSFGIRRTLMI